MPTHTQLVAMLWMAFVQRVFCDEGDSVLECGITKPEVRTENRRISSALEYTQLHYLTVVISNTSRCKKRTKIT